MNITDLMELGDYASEGFLVTVISLTAKRGLYIEARPLGPSGRHYQSAERFTPQQVHDKPLADFKAAVDRCRQAVRDMGNAEARPVVKPTEPKPVCPDCEGTGYPRIGKGIAPDERCGTCDGRGWIAQTPRN